MSITCNVKTDIISLYEFNDYPFYASMKGMQLWHIQILGILHYKSCTTQIWMINLLDSLIYVLSLLLSDLYLNHIQVIHSFFILICEVISFPNFSGS